MDFPIWLSSIAAFVFVVLPFVIQWQRSPRVRARRIDATARKTVRQAARCTRQARGRAPVGSSFLSDYSSRWL